MRVKANALGVLILVLIFGGIAATSAFNLWNTTSTKEPVSFQNGEFEGKYDPADIRGSYTLEDIYNAFGVPVDVLGEAFGLDDKQDLTGFQVKNLESMYEDLKDQGKEIGTNSVRIFVGLYTGLPIEISDEDFLLKPAVDILLQKGTLSGEQLRFVQTNVVDLDTNESNTNEGNTNEGNTNEGNTNEGNTNEGNANEGNTNESNTNEGNVNEGNEDKGNTYESNANEDDEDEKVVKGKTTFYEALSWGITESEMEELIGGEIPTTGMTIRDYCRANGISFSEVKDALNSLIE